MDNKPTNSNMLNSIIGDDKILFSLDTYLINNLRITNKNNNLLTITPSTLYKNSRNTVKGRMFMSNSVILQPKNKNKAVTIVYLKFVNCRVILATRHFLVMKIISSSLINSIYIKIFLY